MPTPYGDITTTQQWLTPAQDELLEVEDTEEEMQENVELFDEAVAKEQDDL